MQRVDEQIKFYDELTGLPNMTLFCNKVNEFIEHKTKNKKFAITYIDIDKFRYIKETLGISAGNELIKHIADRLKDEVTESIVIARLGDDQFAILFTEFQSETILIDKLESIKEKICHTWFFSNYKFYVSLSIGVVLYPDNGSNITTLLQKADIALHSAQKEGKDISFYKEGIQEDITWHLQMLNEIQSGIANKEFTLYYQPQVKLSTNEIIGVEALVRWKHPHKGFVSPAEFIPIAEESKQIFKLEQWIINTALQQKKQWEEEGINHIELSINLSNKTLEDDISFNEIEKIFLSYNVDYTKVVIEVTETATILNIDLTYERLSHLKKFGVKIALDDFGTGCSSLTHLKDLPIDIIKLDKSFVDLIPERGQDTVIIKNILSMADDLHKRVVAEGIETREQLDCLKKFHCHSGQGFLLYKPMSKDRVSELLGRCQDDKYADIQKIC